MIEKTLKLEMTEEYLDFLSIQINEAKELIKKLESVKNNPYALDDQLIARIIVVYQQLSKNSVTDLNHCRGFFKKNISEKETQNFKKIEEMLEELKGLIGKLLFLAEHFKDHTVDKMLSMSDEERAINLIMGKIYSPFQSDDLYEDQDDEDSEDDDDEYDYEEEEDREEGDDENEAFISSLNDKFCKFIEKKPSQELLMSFVIDHTVVDERFLNMFHKMSKNQLLKYGENYEGFYVLITLLMEIYEAEKNQ